MAVAMADPPPALPTILSPCSLMGHSSVTRWSLVPFNLISTFPGRNRNRPGAVEALLWVGESRWGDTRRGFHELAFASTLDELL